MKTFEELHPDLAEKVATGELNSYRKLSASGSVVEYWERDEKGKMVNRTTRAKHEEALERARLEMKRAQMAAARAAQNTTVQE